MLMAAEKRSPMGDIQHVRRDWMSAADMQELVGKLRDYAARIDAQAKALKDLGGDEVYVDGITKPERAGKLLDEYLENVQVALIKKRFRVKEPDTRKRIKKT